MSHNILRPERTWRKDRRTCRGWQGKVERAWVLDSSAESLNRLQDHSASHLPLCKRIHLPYHEAHCEVGFVTCTQTHTDSENLVDVLKLLLGRRLRCRILIKLGEGALVPQRSSTGHHHVRSAGQEISVLSHCCHPDAGSRGGQVGLVLSSIPGLQAEGKREGVVCSPWRQALLSLPSETRNPTEHSAGD